ncbi:hypothetical protein ILUMI_05079 [Ignelater luminosus]|uniref:Mitochondrial proton/calcium exchanger protein n=1 Tax=Ignelater luminosus TaxID=2038154 RepID=A0A8K0DIE2_IGNLU|nr:hypothetical protein ILUMI_05079 [Ignelater luminosus]
MHVLVRSPHFGNRSIKFLKNCSHQNGALKCLCSQNGDKKKYHSFTNHQLPVHNDLVISKLSNQRFNSLLLFHHNNYYSNLIFRNLSLSSIHFEKEPLKPSSKVEATVQVIKKQKEELPAEAPQKAVIKKPLKQRIIDELLHYYHGFRLLFIDVKVSSGLVWRILRGKSLTRREHRLLVRTVGDMFRLVPFSVFIIVPFMEFLLPVFIKLFPGMLPSTFQTATEKEDKIKQNLKVKLEMAKFLQQTLDDMAVQHADHNSQQAKEFNEWFNKVRTSGAEVTNQEIMKYSKLFEDEITLDSLSRSQLVALCRVLEVQTLGTNNLLRFQLRMKLRSLAADDKMIQKEGIDSLTLHEVQQACRARGMRAYGVSEAKLRNQLAQWLDLSLNEKVPPSLLLLSRALMLPETIPTHDKLKATISALPETVATHTKAAIGEKEGKIDNKVKIEIIKEEERKIKEERLESREERKKQEKEKELLVDKAPVISDKDTPILHDPAKIISVAPEKVLDTKATEKHLQAKDLEVIEHALDNISKDTKKFVVEKEAIEDLKEEMADYQEDVQDLKRATADEPTPIVKESKAAQRLFKRVNKMISQLDSVLVDLESREQKLKEAIATDEKDEAQDKKKQELLQIDDIMAAIRKIQDVPDESRIEQIKNVLKKMDDDCDGSVKVEDVLKVIEFIGKDSVQLSAKQVDELIELLDKEEILEVEDKIEKALQKEKELQAEAQQLGKVLDSDKTEQDPKQAGSAQNTVTEQKPPKPKVEAQSSIIPPPPTISSIDSTKTKDRSKQL